MRTFVFGAGASVHAGYPLATTIWPRIKAWAGTTFPSGHVFPAAALEMDSRFDMSKSFELALTDLDERIDVLFRNPRMTSERKLEAHALRTLRSTVSAMIPFYFDSLRSRSAELYRAFAADVLESGDAVITFNYDLALDRALRMSGKWSIGNGYGFEVNSSSLGRSPCKLLKLHGSTNWWGEPFGGREGFGQWDVASPSLGQRPVIGAAELEFLGYPSSADPQCQRGRLKINSLIMPVARKKFYVETTLGREWEPFWDSLWSQAGEALRVSRGIYVIGYSVPEYDTRARELLATRIRSEASLEVCCHNGTAAVVTALQALGLAQAEASPAQTFETWVSRMKASHS